MKESGPCSVCNVPALGRNFNVLSCAACCAFFRRTIADGRKYICDGFQECDVTIQAQRVCRYCRFQKCLDIGMLPARVKRSALKANARHIHLSNDAKVPSDVDNLDKLLLKWQDLNNIRRLHYGHRLDGKLTMAPRATTYQNWSLMESSEPGILWEYLSSHVVFQRLNTTDKMALFENFAYFSRSAETALATVKYEGVESNTIYMLDASFVSCKHKAFKRVFAEIPFLVDPDFISRISLPPMLFIIENLAPAIEAADLSDTEIAALFNLLLWDPANVELSPEGKLLVDKQRQQLLLNLSQLYEMDGIDMPLRLGNLCLLLAPIKEQAHMRQEANRIIDLTLY